MKFQEIFNQDGLYKADSFEIGVAFKVSNGFLYTVIYKTVNDLLPSQENAIMYKGLFNKDYVKVYTIKQLFE